MIPQGRKDGDGEKLEAGSSLHYRVHCVTVHSGFIARIRLCVAGSNQNTAWNRFAVVSCSIIELETSLYEASAK